MFKLNQSTAYFWPVVVNLPANNGSFEKQTFDGEFKRLTDSRLKEIQAKVAAGEITDAEFVREVMVGWKGVSDEGEDVPFSEGNLARMLEIPGTAGAIITAVIESLSGLKRKN